MRLLPVTFLFCLLLTPVAPVYAEKLAAPATLAPESLEDFSSYPQEVQSLIREALALAGQKLSYQYGSATPAKGGMDCSGTMFYLLNSHGVKDVPRQANTIYRWVWQESGFHAVVSPKESSFEFEKLQPGNLLFWSGTYDVDRDPPVTHVMLYLGKRASDGKRVMFGASSGRRYDNIPRDGVSVFDFVLPPAGDKARFLGYASIPGLIPPPAPAPENPPATPMPPETPEPATAEEMTVSESPPPQNTEPAPPADGSNHPPADTSQSMQ